MTGAFETLGVVAGRLPLWDRHMARLRAAADRLAIRFEPPPDLREQATALLERHAHDVLRISLDVGEDEAPRLDLATRARSQELVVALQPIRVSWDGPEAPAGFKATERMIYDRALAEARAAGADDALLLDRQGRLLETSTANVFVEVGGVISTPALDGRILPGIARAVLLDGLRSAGCSVMERDIDHGELAAGGRVWVSNAVHGPRPAAIAGLVRPHEVGLLGQIWSEATAAR